MERDLVERQMAEVHELALGLLQQAERCAVVGLHSQAETILIQVWTIAQAHDPQLASAAAWDIASLLVQRGAYALAGDWFSRITTPPLIRGQLWPQTRHALTRLCLVVAGTTLPAPDSPTLLALPAANDAAPSATLAPLRISSLGHFRIERAGVVLPACKARKAIAVLRYLLTQRYRSAHKEELMELLWPDLSPRKSAHNLHVAVSTLRHYLDSGADSYLRFESGRYTLNPEASIADDCASFRRLVEQADQQRRAGDSDAALLSYTEALACYQGDYYLDDYAYAWALAERERLLARFLAALEQSGHLLHAQAHFEAAAGVYQRLLERDMYREDIHCQLMRCYWQLGRRSEALHQYSHCQQLLRRELGLEPAQETQQLYQAIRASE